MIKNTNLSSAESHRRTERAQPCDVMTSNQNKSLGPHDYRNSQKHIKNYKINDYSFSQSLWLHFSNHLNICKVVCAFLKTIVQTHHTMDYLQKPETYSKYLVHLSKVSIYVNEHQCPQNEKSVSLFTNKI